MHVGTKNTPPLIHTFNIYTRRATMNLFIFDMIMKRDHTDVIANSKFNLKFLTLYYYDTYYMNNCYWDLANKSSSTTGTKCTNQYLKERK